MNVFDIELALGLAAAKRRSGVTEFVSATGEQQRVCMWRGRIAWVHAGRSAGYLSQRLKHALDLREDDFAQFMAECREARRPLGEHVIESGLLSPDQFRHLMWHHNTAHFGALRRSTAPVELPLGFADDGVKYDERFTFTLAEISDLAVSTRDDDLLVDRTWVFSSRFDHDGDGPPEELVELARWFIRSGELELVERRPGLPALLMARAGRFVVAVECADTSFARALIQLRNVAVMVRKTGRLHTKEVAEVR